MIKSQQVLHDLLCLDLPLIPLEINLSLEQFTSAELAELYHHSAILETSIKFIKEAYWIQEHSVEGGASNFKNFISPLFLSELLPLKFLKIFFESSSLKKMKSIGKRALTIEKSVIELVKGQSFSRQKKFAAHALSLMSDIFIFESRLQQRKKELDHFLGLCFYRTFDRLDQLFRLNYSADQLMKLDMGTEERLYERTGVGVQSGYSTMLLALHHLDIFEGARVIDLGSGYGRLGLVVGIMRPDIDFIGYEFVEHRVAISNKASERLDIQDHVKFITQDLSSRSFHIPVADIYYLYDPFSEETYQHVLAQIIEASRLQKIIVVTKGNARAQLLEVAKEQGWPRHQEFDEGNLCLFSSR